MIRVNYCRDGKRHRLAVKGHALYSDSGHDIVCAGVSSLSLALAAYLKTAAVMHEVKYDSGELLIDCSGEDAAEAAFDMAMTGYLNLAHHYPQNVEVYIAANGG